ncbi:Brp/Blh family beta-carotene 15,15'-dioxygenase [Aquimarina sp. 2-A2]|uniref:Brp/Blh family beta-carotene 15,15'-dioxygenase n=1 Tax=Aquimarina sp. 2-A2 TaxID=3382644 RepID=UPI00387F3019
MNRSTIFLENLKSFKLISTFFSLWFAVYFTENIEDYFAFFFILSLGILHGANDLKLIEKVISITDKKQLYKVIALYLCTIAIGILTFYYFPAIGLLLFIFFSAYHFGEQHWSSRIKESSIPAKFMFMAYGFLILSSLFYFNNIEVSLIIDNIAGIYLKKNFYLYTLFIAAIVVCLLGFKLHMELKLKVRIIEELFYLLVFLVVFHTASLLWAFAIYFIFWHSIPSLVDQVNYLYGNTKKENFIAYLKSSFLNWFISIIGLTILYYLFNDDDRLFLSIFFTLIASITFPHVWVMSKFNK